MRDVKKDAEERVRENMLRWFGHVERMNGESDLPGKGKLDGKRGKGRPRKRYEDQIQECLKEKNVLSRK